MLTPFFGMSPLIDASTYTADGLVRSVRMGGNRSATVEMGGNFCVTVHAHAAFRITRRSSARQDVLVGGFAETFFDRPGESLCVGLEGEARILQIRIPVALAERILLEDHDLPSDACLPQSGRVGVRLDLLNSLARGLLEDGPDALSARTVLGQLVSAGSRRTAPRRGISPIRMKRVRDYVASDPAAASLAGMAAVAELSVFHFSREFRLETGATPSHYIALTRLWRAMDQLSSGDVAEPVAKRLGFSHASHLGRTARRFLGTSPGRARLAVYPVGGAYVA